MKIQFNTDKTIISEQRHHNHFTSLIESGLKRYQSHITRIEAHISDENGKKQGKWMKRKDGVKFYAGQFKDDIPVGEFKYYYPNGKLKISTHTKLARMNYGIVCGFSTRITEVYS